MQENDFEKQVRKLMDEVVLPPSEPVWEYVEKRIPKSSRKRRFAALFLLLVGFAVSSYFFYEKYQKSNTVQSKDNAVTRKHSEKATTDERAGKKNKESITEHNNNDIIKSGELRGIGKQDLAAGLEKGKVTPKQEQQNSVVDIQAQKPTANKHVVTHKALNKTGAGQNNNDQTVVAQNKTGIEEETNGRQSVQEQPSPLLNDSAATALVDITPATTVNKDSMAQPAHDSLQTTAVKKINKKATEKKWQYGITLMYGKGDMVQSITNPNKNAPADYASSPGGPVSDSVFSEKMLKNIKAKSSFSAGVTVRRQLSARSSILAELGFTRLNTTVETGMYKDSAAVFNYNNSGFNTVVQRYYRPGTGNTINNSYSMLQLPVLYELQLNRSKRFHLLFDAGFSLTRLIGSNAVLYDSYNAAYYNNNSLLRKTQLHLQAGLNMEYVLRSKSSIVLGPHLQYGISNIAKDKTSNQHFFAWGLKAKYFLKK